MAAFSRPIELVPRHCSAAQGKYVRFSLLGAVLWTKHNRHLAFSKVKYRRGMVSTSKEDSGRLSAVHPELHLALAHTSRFLAKPNGSRSSAEAIATPTAF